MGRFGQHLMRSAALSLAILSNRKLLGKHFYKLNPAVLLITALPLSLVMIAFKIYRRNQSDKLLERCEDHIEQHNTDSNPSKTPTSNMLLRIEKSLYLMTDFFADTLQTTEVAQTFFISLISITLGPTQLLIFLFAITYAVYIHSFYRAPDVNDIYMREENIAKHLPTQLDLKPLAITVTTYLLFTASFALNVSNPLLSFSLLILATISLACYALKFISTNYVFFAAYGVNRLINNFSRNLLKQIKALKLSNVSPVIISATELCITALVLSYTCSYYLQTQRHQQLKAQLDLHDEKLPSNIA